MKIIFTITCILLFSTFTFAQNENQATIDIPLKKTVSTDSTTISDSVALYDIVDLFKDISPFRKKSNKDTIAKKRSSLSYLPNINYNPSIGFQVGVKAVGGLYLGDKSNTTMSIFAAAANYTTKGIKVGYVFHDMYSKGNKWNFKGSVMVSKLVSLDYGMGIGIAVDNPTQEELVLNNPNRDRYVIEYTQYGFSERAYKQLAPGLFLGAGVYFELKRNIQTLGAHEQTPNSIYSASNGFDATRNNNNGLIASLQYMTRDNPNSAYKGIYTDVVIRSNQKWLGSSEPGIQLLTDFRKYWQLSTERPNHVLALWYYGSYTLGGSLPYLNLPGTGKDPYARSGRGYTNGYFKGNSYAYTEVEYRFPILRNQFLSGVVFGNIQSVNDQMGTPLFKNWQPAGGAGLRVLFNKLTRTNLCIDYAFGKFGQKGLFLGLNEAF